MTLNNNMTKLNSSPGFQKWTLEKEKHSTEKSPLIAQSTFALLRKGAQDVGNKAANLKILGSVTKKIPYLTVPTLHAVSHQTVSDFLTKHSKGKFQEMWKEFCQAMQGEQVLSKKIRSLLKEIQTLVINTFRQEGTHIHDIKEFLSNVPPNCRTIIRSSGREDTMQLSNAGGNKTCINIPPEKEAIAEAIGEVVASYFSERSIGQRLQAGDSVIREPFMPVLLQVMVGESEKGFIPASGVIFSDESTGKTPGVSCIEGAFGHNELVVGGLGPVDRYFVGPIGRIHKLIAYKKERLVSRQKGKGLFRVANPSDICKAPAFESHTLLQLHRFYQDLKPLYGGHVDGEFTKLDHSKELLHLLQVRPLPQRRKLNPTYLNVAALEDRQVAKASSMVPTNCRVRILEASDEVHYGTTVGEARKTFLALPSGKQARVKVIVVSTPGGSNSHEATEFRANNLPVLCLQKEERRLIKAPIENKQMLLLVDVVEGKIVTIPRSKVLSKRLTEEDLIKSGVIVEGWSKHPLPMIQSIMGEGLSDHELNTFIGELVEACRQLMLLPGELPGNVTARLHLLFSLMKNGKLEIPSFDQIIERIGSDDIGQRMSAVAMVLKVAYTLCVTYKKTALKERAIAVSRQLIADAKEVWDIHKPERKAIKIQKLYAINWLSATLTQQSSAGIVNADSPFTLLSRKKELDAAKKILLVRGGFIDDYRIDMLSVMLRIGDHGLNNKVRNDWRSFCISLCRDGDKKLISNLAVVLHRIASVEAVAYWLHALFLPIWRKSKKSIPCLINLVIETSRSINALKTASGILNIAERIEKVKARVISHEMFDKYWKNVLKDLQILNGIHKLYSKQNSFGRSLLSSAVGEVVESLDGMIKEMLGQPGKEAQKVQMLQAMLKPYFTIMHDWLKLIDSQDVPGHDDVRQVNEQIGKIAETLFNAELLQRSKLNDQLNISAHFNVSAAQVGSGANFDRHKPENLADLFTLVHQNILFALAYLQKKEDVFIEHLPMAVQTVAKALASTEMLNFRVENGKQRFISCLPSLISLTVDFPTVTMRYNAPQRNHSALFEIIVSLNPQTGEIKELTVGGKLFGYQAQDMPRMPWAAAYAELCARAGGLDFSKDGTPTYDRSRDMVGFTWIVDKSQVKKFAKNLPDYLTLITTSLYTGSRSRCIPIPRGKKNFIFTDNWGMPKLDHTDNCTTLGAYYSRDDVDLAASSKLRLEEAIANIQRIHPEWGGESLRSTDLGPISDWHRFVQGRH